MFELKTKLGEINFSQNAINKIVVAAVEQCDGKAGLMNFKGKYVSNVTGIASMMNLYDEESESIQFREDEDGLELEIYIVVHFGISIKKITEKIIDYIYKNIEEMLEIKPQKVTVLVTGVMSKNIAKRHVEVSR
ncbi:MAG: Asp23/Gls24 family envelope stress response protein [Clostridiales bacterium]|nr:Asp23/Gls24 family envelope stress response protein [Clostridiales bacterium]